MGWLRKRKLDKLVRHLLIGGGKSKKLRVVLPPHKRGKVDPKVIKESVRKVTLLQADQTKYGRLITVLRDAIGGILEEESYSYIEIIGALNCLAMDYHDQMQED